MDELEEYRRQLIEERRREFEKRQHEEREAIELEKERLWGPYLRQIAKSQELSIAWKSDLDIFRWERVFPHKELSRLQVTGHPIQQLPDQLPIKLPMLTSLKLVACDLDHLPDEV